MTLLSICTQAAQYAGIQAPTSIVGNTDNTAQLLYAAASLAGQSVARRPQGGWVSQILEHDFLTQASTTDYSGSVGNTGPNGVAQIVIVNGVDDTLLDGLDTTWIAQGAGLLNNSVVQSVSVDTGTYTYTITINQPCTSATPGTYSFGKSDYTLPSDFQRPIDNTFWDRTNYWQMRGPLSPQQWQVYKSSVIGTATIQRRYRFRYIQGQTRLSIDPTPFDNGSSLVFEYVSNAFCQSAAGVAQSQWLADDDIGVVSEYLMELEVIWRVLRRLGISYSDEQAEAERQIDKAVATDGAAAILSLAPVAVPWLLGPWSIPESGYGQGGVTGGFIIGVSEIGGPGL